MDTARVRKLLAENGHNPGNVIVDSHVDNCNNKLEGTWVFEDNNCVKVEKAITPERKTNNRRKNSRKTKKSLDKLVEDVIIEE